MFSSKLSRFVVVASLSTLAVAACQTQRVSEQTAQKITSVQTEVRLGRSALTNTTGSLKILRDAKNDEVKPAFDIYSKSVQDLEDKAQGVGFVLDTAVDQASQYFAKWDKSISEISNENMQASAEERKAEMMDAFNDVHAKINKLRGDFRPYMSKLKDIQKAMAADPTPAGKSAAVPMMRETLDQEGTILKDIDAVDKSLESLKTR
jgi:uncharacterized coiled-coil DUF342 family protein